MSPETTLNGQVDHRSDLFALGVILYLLCCGAMPFSGKDSKEIVKKIRAGQYKPVLEIAPNVPPRIASLVERLLAPNSADRPQRGQEVVAELNEISRQLGIESSAQNIATFLAQLFPDDVAGVALGFDGKEIVRASPEEMGSLTTKDKSRISTEMAGNDRADRSPVSITPSGVSSRLAAVDVSESFRRSSRELPTATPSKEMPVVASIAVPVATEHVPVPAPPVRAPVRAPVRPVLPKFPAKPRSNTIGNVLIIMVVLAIGALAAYLITSS